MPADVLPSLRLVPFPLTRVHIPGFALACAVGVIAWLIDRWLAPAMGLPRGTTVMVLALVLGIALNPFYQRHVDLNFGITVAAKVVLRWGVALLGFRIMFSDILALGPETLAVTLGGLVLTILAGVGIARLFGRSTEFGLLTGGATAICGASAALAIASVLPRSGQKSPDTLFTVAAMNALSTLAMVAYPLIALGLGFSQTAAGILFGAAIHDTAQVVGAGASVSETALATATIVKLTRVLCLVAVVAAIAALYRGSGRRDRESAVTIPGFALAFLVFVAMNSTGLVPDLVRMVAAEASKWFLIIAVAALGIQTSLTAMAALGWQHFAVTLAQTVAQLAIILTLMVLFGLAP